MKIAAVILNYNDAEGTVSAVRRIDGFSCFDNIIVVDNASTDGSWDVIRSELGHDPDRIVTVRAEKNGGYGSGNNIGVRLAQETCGAELAVIANPDSVFGEKLVRDMAAVFEAHPDAAVVGCVMHSGDDRRISYTELIHAGWKHRGLAGSVLNGGPLMRRLFRKRINYPFSVYKSSRVIPVYAVHGSLLMVSVRSFAGMGGYDERVFLYGEENILGEKCRKAGYGTYLLRETYGHEGSVSIKKAGLDAVRRQRIRNASENLYYIEYLGAGRMEMAIVRLFQAAVLLETALFGRFL